MYMSLFHTFPKLSKLEQLKYYNLSKCGIHALQLAVNNAVQTLSDLLSIECHPVLPLAVISFYCIIVNVTARLGTKNLYCTHCTFSACVGDATFELMKM